MCYRSDLDKLGSCLLWRRPWHAYRVDGFRLVVTLWRMIDCTSCVCRCGLLARWRVRTACVCCDTVTRLYELRLLWRRDLILRVVYVVARWNIRTVCVCCDTMTRLYELRRLWRSDLILRGVYAVTRRQNRMSCVCFGAMMGLNEWCLLWHSDAILSVASVVARWDDETSCISSCVTVLS